MRTSRPVVLAWPCLLVVAACSSNSSDNGSAPGTSVGAADCSVVVKDSDCDKSQRPFVFIHGTYGSGDNFAHVAALLASNGFCADRIVSVEYDSLGEKPGNTCTDDPPLPGCGKVDAAIDKVLAATGADKVDLAGHSQGTMHAGIYLNGTDGTGTADPTVAAAHQAKVAHYINFSGSPDVGDVDTLSLSSEHDLPGPPPPPHHATGNHVKAVTFHDEDHFAVAASTRSFVEVYKYLRNGDDPKYTEVQCGDDPVKIEGLSETFADNVPVGGRIELREIGDTPRSTAAPALTLTPDADGHFGPVEIKRNVAYEMRGFDANGKLVGSQYFTPFKRDNRLVRLLTPASADDGSPLMIGMQPVGKVIAAASTDHIVRGPDHVAMVVRWAGGAFRQDLGASLTVDGTEVLTDVTAGATALANQATSGGVVGLFMYDANTNKKTDLGMVASGPFLMFTDVFMDATKPAFIELKFKGGSEDVHAAGSLRVDNYASSDGTVLAFFQ